MKGSAERIPNDIASNWCTVTLEDGNTYHGWVRNDRQKPLQCADGSCFVAHTSIEKAPIIAFMGDEGEVILHGDWDEAGASVEIRIKNFGTCIISNEKHTS